MKKKLPSLARRLKPVKGRRQPTVFEVMPIPNVIHWDDGRATLDRVLAAVKRLHVEQMQIHALLKHLVAGCGRCGVPADLHNTADHLFVSR